MSRRQNNQLPNNLPQLQNLIKRDPESYEEEFLQQLRHFSSTLQVFALTPTEFNESLDELVMFLAQVAKCYPEQLSNYPQTLIDLLRKHATVLNTDMRLSFCRALILLRHKDLLAPVDLLQLFFDLLRCQDKALRKYLRDHIISDLTSVNSKQKDARLNRTMQNFMFTMLKDSHKIAAKTSLDVMIELYRKNVWKDAKTVNVISTACFSEITKLMVTAVKFFLGNDEDGGEDRDDSDDEDDDLPTMREVKLANKVNKKSRKRKRFLENVKKAHSKKKKKEKNESFNFSALHLVHDPQGFAENIFKKMDTLKEKFEVKLLYLDLVSRLIGTHQLILLNYYPYIARFLTPHQREVIHILQYSAQSAHELVPPDSIEPVVRAIVNNFVTERNSGEVMAIGLNAIREITKRCPLALDETLLRDLAAYKSYKDKAVMMAARSLIQTYRTIHPELLHKKDRGRPTEAMAEILSAGLKYGEGNVKDCVPGAESLELEEPMHNNTDHTDSDSDWEDVIHSSNEEDDYEKLKIVKDEEVKAGRRDSSKEENDFLTHEEKTEKAKLVTSSRFLSDAEFKKIDTAQLKKEVQAFRKGKKGKKRSMVEATVDNDDFDGVSETHREELVDLANIEMVHKKRRHDKEARLATVLEGREGREKFGSRKGKMNTKSSTTNKQKLKNKNFMMVKGKFKAKAKKSFVQKQKDLKKAMLRSRKFK